MSKCKICHAAKPWDELDERGRCPSCRDAYLAHLNGLHYGDYMSRKPKAYVLPVTTTPLRELPVMNPEKVCRICGKPILPGSRRRTLCSLECQAEFNRQSAKAAHAKAKARKAQTPRPERFCVICGAAISGGKQKYCSEECAHESYKQRDRVYRRKRTERAKNCNQPV